MHINFLSSVNNFAKISNQTPVQKNVSQVSFKSLEKDITDFTNSRKDVQDYIKTMFTYYPESPDNVNDNFEIDGSKEGLNSFKLKNFYMGYPPEIKFFGSLDKQIEYLKKNNIEFNHSSNDVSVEIRYEENDLDYTAAYSKNDAKLEYARVNNNLDVHKYDLNPMQASLNPKKNGYEFTFSNENRNRLCASLFKKSRTINFNKDMKVIKTTSETIYTDMTISQEALFNSDGSVIKYNKSKH